MTDTERAQAHLDQKDNGTATVASLAAIDQQIIATTGGEPGTGLYSLLNMLAGQFLGVPRAAMPAKKEPAAVIEDEPEAEPKETNASRGHHRTK